MKKIDLRTLKRANKRAIVGSAVACLLLTGAVFALLPKRSQTIVINVAPPEREDITSFGTVKVVYAQDGTTVLERHIPYSDGGLGHQFYRPDGTLKETAEHYPLRSGASQPVLKSKSTWSNDGKSIQTGEVYRPDGSLWFTFKDLGNGRRQDTNYFKDGWKFSQSEFSPTDSKREIVYYQRNGQVWAKEVQERNYSSYFNERSMTVFDPTGARMLFKTVNVGWNETVDGFNPGNASGKLVTFYNESGKPSHRQFYNNYWNSYLNASGTMLMVQVFDQWGSVNKTFDVDETNDTVKIKTSSKPDGSRKVFRDFGKNIRRLSIEKITVQGQPLERFLQIGTCSWELDSSFTKTEHEDTDRVYDIFDIAHFAAPNEQDLREKRTASLAENRGVLGLRDDTDPVKWYHKQ